MLKIWKSSNGLIMGWFSDKTENQKCRDEIEKAWNKEFPKEKGYCFPIVLPGMPPMQSLQAERVDYLISKGYKTITDKDMKTLITNYKTGI